MNTFDKSKITLIGIDHGYGNIKTAHCCFRTSVAVYDKEPVFKNSMLIYDDKYYIFGDDHKEFVPDKAFDQDYYILTLAAIGRELSVRGMTDAYVFLAAGLPLTWVSEQKESFIAYLLQKPSVEFVLRGIRYHVEFAGADVYPQGFSAVATHMSDFRGVNMLCDIGNGTMNIMYINNGRPVSGKCYTEKYGTHQCVLTVREKLTRKLGTKVDDAIIEDVLRHGTAEIGNQYLAPIQEGAAEYTAGIMRTLREREYNPDLMKLYVLGGGGCLIRNFSSYDPNRVIINSDIRATAKGYEALAARKLGIGRTGGV